MIVSIDGLFWRALAAFLAMPGIVAFLVPWLLRPDAVAFRAWGLVPLGIGGVLLLWCVRDFYTAGRGTLAPWAPPERLVTIGLYQFTRNPMYIAVVLILIGWALTFPSIVLWLYAGAIAVAFHLRVVWGEEPWLAERHGEEWTSYAARVPRWGLSLHRTVLDSADE
jgi:protein-S-isoprenylcysteine O-methyltransferase Ste14